MGLIIHQFEARLVLIICARIKLVIVIAAALFWRRMGGKLVHKYARNETASKVCARGREAGNGIRDGRLLLGV